MTDMEIAWVAGIIEGEGNIHTPQTNDNYPILSVAMCDFDIIKRLQDITGAGTIAFVPRSEPHHSDQLKWTVSHRKQSSRILLAVYPLMGERRKREISKAADRLSRPLRKRYIAVCGTEGGYQKHHKLGEQACDDCRKVHNEISRGFKKKFREDNRHKDFCDCGSLKQKESTRCGDCYRNRILTKERQEIEND